MPSREKLNAVAQLCILWQCAWDDYLEDVGSGLGEQLHEKDLPEEEHAL
eukprot:CAMPEP_0184381688 /NCGR_PEP_ID=MMETSP0007-20130409/5718_1 /TAXON_ID=97485 /ORGANISM="Prymnesium parvum, Strain Texoma1" /LENGTH=48 /DNA_ID= /DNA_START= /DNA_END= /DNA_ORIENTATION=